MRHQLAQAALRFHPSNLCVDKGKALSNLANKPKLAPEHTSFEEALEIMNEQVFQLLSMPE